MLFGPAIILSCLILGFGSSPAPDPAADPLDNINLHFPNKDFIKDTPVLVHFDKENIDVPLQDLMPEPKNYPSPRSSHKIHPPDRELGYLKLHPGIGYILPDSQHTRDEIKRMPKTKGNRGNSRNHKHGKNKNQGYRKVKYGKNQGHKGPRKGRPHRNPYKSTGSFKKYGKNGNHGHKGYPRNQYRPKISYKNDEKGNQGHKGSPRNEYINLKPKIYYKDDDNDNHADYMDDYIVGGKKATAG